MKLNPSDLPFSLDLVERSLFWVVVSYFASSFASFLGFSFPVLFLTFSLVGTASVFALDRIKVDPTGKAVLITGCDTGFGNAISRKLHSLGYTVFAACYSTETEGAKALQKEFPNRMFVFSMDVSSDDNVNKAMEYVKNHLPDGAGLWAVITNAGLSSFGQVEWVPLDVYKKTMDINFFGTVRTVKATLPLIRQAKGRVITIASMMGRFGAPARSPYCCSKWSVEGLTECLRLEMKRWGVSVTCVEPGNFIAGTAIYANDAVKKQADHMWTNLPQNVRDDYTKEYFDAFINKMSYYASNGDTNIDPVVNTLVDAVGHTYPQTRYQIFSLDEKVKAFVSTHLPSIVFDYLYNNM